MFNSILTRLRAGITLIKLGASRCLMFLLVCFFSLGASALLHGQDTGIGGQNSPNNAGSDTPLGKDRNGEPKDGDPGLSGNGPAQDLDGGDAPQDKPAPAGNARTVYYIRQINFNRTGLTRQFALLEKGELKTGERITGAANLEKYREQKAQLLTNQRVLDRADIQYTLGPPEADGSVPVDLLVTTVDSWNIIALPYPKYDDNNGFELIIKARDYNFLGTMNPLRIDLGYQLDAEYMDNFFKNLSKGNFVFSIDSDTPFTFLGYTWTLNFDHNFAYTYDQPLYYKNTTGIAIEYPVDLMTATFGFEEATVANEDNEKEYEHDYIPERDGSRFKDLYMASTLFVSYKIPTGFFVEDYGEITYNPKLSGTINITPGEDVGYLRQGPKVAFDHTLGFGQIDWIENFRRGIAASLGNDNSYNFFRQEWSSSAKFSLTGHFILPKLFGVSAGISGRAQYRHWFHGHSNDAADALRGILDKAMAANSMLSLNLDFPFQVLRFTPSKWLNAPKLKLFDVDAHISPILDLALVNDPVHNLSLSPRDIQATGGVELIIFSHFMRSLYLRISAGVNLREMLAVRGIPDGNNREIFIGLGHHY